VDVPAAASRDDADHLGGPPCAVHLWHLSLRIAPSGCRRTCLRCLRREKGFLLVKRAAQPVGGMVPSENSAAAAALVPQPSRPGRELETQGRQKAAGATTFAAFALP